MGKLERSIKNLAREFGFDIVGITTAESFPRDEKAALDRIEHGLMDGLGWYTKERVHKANRPALLVKGARSIISVAMSYNTGDPCPGKLGPTGKIARYAWGDDYHDLMKERLSKLVKALPAHVGHPVQTRIFVDDGPMNDRAAAERAGVGWFGKNSNVLTRSHGSWVLLGQIITDLALEPDTPLKKTCGSCVRCIDDCPTGAIVAPFTIDNTRCISFLTIELRGSIPRELRSLVGDWVFGCDICQEVCPVNRTVALGTEPAFQQRHDFGAPALLPLLELNDDEFSTRFRNSAIKRAKRVGLQRNVCVALGNIGDPVSGPALTRSLSAPDPVIREHAAWALGRLGSQQTLRALRDALPYEADEVVRTEITLSLSEAEARVLS